MARARLEVIKKMYGQNFLKSEFFKNEPIFGWTVYTEDGTPLMIDQMSDDDILSLYDVDFN